MCPYTSISTQPVALCSLGQSSFSKTFTISVACSAAASRRPGLYAAVALHYLDGFSERFGRAASAGDALFEALRNHETCQVLRSAAATNVTRLNVLGSDAAALPERLLARGIAIRRALRSSPEGAEFELVTNETILRRPIAEIIEAFVKALRPA